MRAVNDFLIIEPIIEEVKSASGLVYDGKSREDLRYMKGRVLSVSDDIGFGISVDDIVLYDKVRAYEARIDDTMRTIIRKIDVVLVF